jgi:hypothetical protein
LFAYALAPPPGIPSNQRSTGHRRSPGTALLPDCHFLPTAILTRFDLSHTLGPVLDGSLSLLPFSASDTDMAVNLLATRKKPVTVDHSFPSQTMLTSLCPSSHRPQDHTPPFPLPSRPLYTRRRSRALGHTRSHPPSLSLNRTILLGPIYFS